MIPLHNLKEIHPPSRDRIEVTWQGGLKAGYRVSLTSLAYGTFVNK
ncbi:hypothetical protein [Nostoc sp.]